MQQQLLQQPQLPQPVQLQQRYERQRKQLFIGGRFSGLQPRTAAVHFLHARHLEDHQ